jgi:hypothetical protein
MTDYVQDVFACPPLINPYVQGSLTSVAHKQITAFRYLVVILNLAGFSAQFRDFRSACMCALMTFACL